MKFIVLGAVGRMGSLHAKHLRELGHDVTGVDPAGGEYEEATGWRKYRVDEWPHHPADGIVIATPAEQHAADINTVLAAGIVKHIFVEKPICLIKQLPGMRRMAMDAKLAGVTIHVGYNLRFHPAVQGLVSARDEGRMGTILHASFILRQIPRRLCANFREEWASHEVDLALYLLGRTWTKVAYTDWGSGLPTFKCVVLHHLGMVSSIHVDGYYEPNVRSITLVDADGHCFHRDIEADHVRDEHYREEIRTWTEEITNPGGTTLAAAVDGIAAIDLFTKGSNL